MDLKGFIGVIIVVILLIFIAIIFTGPREESFIEMIKSIFTFISLTT